MFLSVNRICIFKIDGVKFVVPYVSSTVITETHLRFYRGVLALHWICFWYRSHGTGDIALTARTIYGLVVFPHTKNSLVIYGADSGTRTHTVFPPTVFETVQPTNSIMSTFQMSFSASGGVTPAAATERKERESRVLELHPEKYTLSDLRPNYQKSSRIFSHQGDQSELRGATLNFWPQSFNHFFFSVSRAFCSDQPSSPKVIEGFRQTINTRIAKAPGRD